MAEKRTRSQLAEELARLRQRVDELEAAVSVHGGEQQKVLQCEESLRMLFAATNDLILVLDTDGTIVQANRAVCERLGYTQVELFGKSVLDIHPPDRRKDAEANFADLLAGRASNCPIPLLCSNVVGIVESLEALVSF